MHKFLGGDRMLKEGDYVHIEAVQDSWYKLPQVDKQSASQKRLRSSVLVGGRPSWFAPAFWDLGRGHQLRARRGQQKRFRLLGPFKCDLCARQTVFDDIALSSRQHLQRCPFLLFFGLLPLELLCDVVLEIMCSCSRQYAHDARGLHGR